MKKIFGSLVVISALLMAFSFIGCDNGTKHPADGGQKDDTVATFINAEKGYTITCKKDNTWIYHEKLTPEQVDEALTEMGMEELKGKNIVVDFDRAKGTYTGNPAEDGEFTITTTKETDWWTMLAALATIGVTKKLTNEEVPLVTLETPKTETITIKDGSFVFDNETFTRK